MRKDVKFEFNKKCQLAFDKIKREIISDRILKHFDPNKITILTCDASSYGVGAVLSQRDELDREYLVAFASKTLNSAEKNYSQIDKEALAIIFGINKFNNFVWGRQFIIKCDCKPLVSIFGPKKGIPIMTAGRLQRYAVFLSGYDFKIQFVSSNKNSADGLSRLPIEIKNAEYNQTSYLHCIDEMKILNASLVKKETNSDPVLSKVKYYILNGWPEEVIESIQTYKQKRELLSLEQNTILWGHRVVIPKVLRNKILNELHQNHLGIVKMKSIAKAHVWWPKIDKDIENIANGCERCMETRVMPKKTVLHTWEWPQGPWQRLHADYLGPFKGYQLLIIEDAYSKWLEVFIINSTGAQSAIETFKNVFARFGLPEYLVTDNGPPFTSLQFQQFLKENGIGHRTSSPYYPQSNGQAESGVKIIKTFFKKNRYF